MPRPTRIEYECAFHHVMNRGRHRRVIFHDARYFEAFLKCLEEAHQRFGAVIHAYCLMSNHYHLLIETPKANLSQIMKHINGLYTQRYNRLKKVDGPLFRGRYKSVLVDADTYLLQLSRYIHRNPLEVKKRMVERLEDYQWSSYPAYSNKVKPPEWLYRDKTYQMLGHKQRYIGYAKYVDLGIDEDIQRFYNKSNTLSVLGDNEFRETQKALNKALDTNSLRLALEDKPPIDAIVDQVAKITKTTVEELRMKKHGRKLSAPGRAFAIYAANRYSDARYQDIAKYFNLSHAGSVSAPISRIRKDIEQGNWKKEIAQLENGLL